VPQMPKPIFYKGADDLIATLSIDTDIPDHFKQIT
jgi:hypothetical protein